MARGKKPIPTHLKLILGNRGKRPINEDEPKPRRERPSAPEHISDRAREAWGAVVLVIDEMGVLTAPDIIAIEMLCEAIADHRDAVSTIKASALHAAEEKAAGKDPDYSADGRYYKTANQSGGVMWRSHPALALKSDADRRIRGWCSEFGLTPSARSRLVVGSGADGANNKDRAEAYFA